MICKQVKKVKVKLLFLSKFNLLLKINVADKSIIHCQKIGNRIGDQKETLRH